MYGEGNSGEASARHRAAAREPVRDRTKAPDLSEALRESVDFIVVAGGDGTVVKAIDRVRERNLPIAILPLGSANNIARSVGTVCVEISPDPMTILMPANVGFRR